MIRLLISIKGLFADKTTPSDELKLVQMANNYLCKFKNYKYFINYEKKFGTEIVRGFWGVAILWIKQLERDASGNWSLPAELIQDYKPEVSLEKISYCHDDSNLMRIFVVENGLLMFSTTLESSKRDAIIYFIRDNYVGGMNI